MRGLVIGGVVLAILAVLLAIFAAGLVTGSNLSQEDTNKILNECNTKLVEQNAPRNTTCELTYKFVEKK